MGRVGRAPLLPGRREPGEGAKAPSSSPLDGGGGRFGACGGPIVYDMVDVVGFSLTPLRTWSAMAAAPIMRGAEARRTTEAGGSMRR